LAPAARGRARRRPGACRRPEPDGTGKTRITTNPAGDLDPAFFPDGSKIVFVRELPSPNPGDAPADIWTINADGTGETNLTPGPQRETEPAVSPDGTKIAFERGVESTESHDSGNHEIFTMNATAAG
jgi:TolB protein